MNPVRIMMYSQSVLLCVVHVRVVDIMSSCCKQTLKPHNFVFRLILALYISFFSSNCKCCVAGIKCLTDEKYTIAFHS